MGWADIITMRDLPISARTAPMDSTRRSGHAGTLAATAVRSNLVARPLIHAPAAYVLPVRAAMPQEVGYEFSNRRGDNICGNHCISCLACSAAGQDRSQRR